MISQYIHGHTRPSLMAVKAFERVLSDAGAGGGAVAVIPGTETRNYEQQKQQTAALRRLRGKAAALAAEIAIFLVECPEKGLKPGAIRNEKLKGERL